jgi:hypothetical protein
LVKRRFIDLPLGHARCSLGYGYHTDRTHFHSLLHTIAEIIRHIAVGRGAILVLAGDLRGPIRAFLEDLRTFVVVAKAALNASCLIYNHLDAHREWYWSFHAILSSVPAPPPSVHHFYSVGFHPATVLL